MRVSRNLCILKRVKAVVYNGGDDLIKKIWTCEEMLPELVDKSSYHLVI